MTDVPGFEPEPTNYQIMAAIQQLAEGQQALSEVMMQSFAHLATEVAKANAKIDGAVDDLRGEIRATEAALVSRIDSVQQVVRSVKADVARHLDDHDHGHPHAA